MKVRLFLAERANIPTYDHGRNRAIDGEWEPGQDYIAVPFGVLPLQDFHGNIQEPIHIPLGSCQWWAPLRMIRAAEPDMVGVEGPVKGGVIPNAGKRGKR